jgi:chemotaxis protein MotA
MFFMTIFGVALALGAILSGQALEGSRLGTLAQPTAFLIVLGGTAGAVIAQSSPRDFGQAFRMLKWLFKPPVEDKDPVKEIMGWARIAYKDGILQLDNLTTRLKDPLLRNGLEMVVDQYDPVYIRDTLLMEIRVRDSRYRNAAKVWEAAGGYSPTIGILGSVLGLLHVMDSLADVAALGAGVAVSFVATLYGLGLANLIFLPIAAKLKSVIFEITLRDEMRIEGLTMIAQAKNPRQVEKTLKAFEESVSPSKSSSNPA